MNMKWLLIEITETVEELKAIMHSQVKAKLKERVHALYIWKAAALLRWQRRINGLQRNFVKNRANRKN